LEVFVVADFLKLFEWLIYYIIKLKGVIYYIIKLNRLFEWLIYYIITMNGPFN